MSASKKKAVKRAKKAARKPCSCISAMNAALAERHVELDLVVPLRGGQVYPRIATNPIGKLRRGRSKLPVVVPSFCPFCGWPYEPKLAKGAIAGQVVGGSRR